jgi:hypothetical protein
MQNKQEKTEVIRISKGEANDVLKQYHYLGPVGTGISYALLINSDIKAVAVFSNNKIIGGYKVCELTRYVLTENKKNYGSRFLSEILKKIIGVYDAVISYADANVGHKGTIYSAIGAVYLGQGKESVGFMVNGKLYSGRNISYSLLGKESLAKPTRIAGKHKFLLVINKKRKYDILKVFGK